VPAFRNVIDVPLVVRGLRKSRSEVCVLLENDILSHLLFPYLHASILTYQVRKELGLEENAKVLLFNFGGQVGHLGNLISLGHMFHFFSCSNVLCGYFKVLMFTNSPSDSSQLSFHTFCTGTC